MPNCCEPELFVQYLLPIKQKTIHCSSDSCSSIHLVAHKLKISVFAVDIATAQPTIHPLQRGPWGKNTVKKILFGSVCYSVNFDLNVVNPSQKNEQK